MVRASPLKSSSGFGMVSRSDGLLSSSTMAASLFYHQVAKLRRHPAVSPSRSRRMWRIVGAVVRFTVRLRNASTFGVRLSDAEFVYLQKVYWECSQQPEGLHTLEGVTKLLLRFNQPQPPTTVEQLMRWVNFVPESESGPISFGQIVQVMRQLKREHVALTAVNDEEELYHQLSVAVGNPGSGSSHPPHAAAVDASAVAAVLKSFDLRVAPPEHFVSSASKPSHGGERSYDDSDARRLMKFDEFCDFLNQRPRTAPGESGSSAMASTRRKVLSPPALGNDLSFASNPMNADSVPSPELASGTSPTHLQVPAFTLAEATPTVPAYGGGQNAALLRDATHHSTRGHSPSTGDTVAAWSSETPAATHRCSARERAFDDARALQYLEDEGHSAEFLRLQQRLVRCGKPLSATAMSHPGGAPVAQGTVAHSYDAIADEVARLSAHGPWILKDPRRQSSVRGTATCGGGAAAPASRTAASRSRAKKSTAAQLVRTAVAPAVLMMPSTRETSPGQVRRVRVMADLPRSSSPFRVGSQKERPGSASSVAQQVTSPSPQARKELSPAGCAPSVLSAAPRQGAIRRPKSAQPIVHSGQWLPKGTGSPPNLSPSDALNGCPVKSYETHVPNLWVTAPTKRTGADSTTSGAEGAAAATAHQAESRSGHPTSTLRNGDSPPLQNSGSSPVARPVSAMGPRDDHRPAPAASRGGSICASGVPAHSIFPTRTLSSAFQVPHPARPASASLVRKRLDVYLHPTPLEDLAATPSFRLSESQQERVTGWYQSHYARLSAAGETALPLAQATRKLAASVSSTLAFSSARELNDARSADPHEHAHNPLEEYLFERQPHASPTDKTQQQLPQHLRHGHAVTATTTATGYGPVWLRGSSYDTALKQRPPHLPPSGFATSS